MNAISPSPEAAAELDPLNSPIETGLTVIEASAGTGKTYSISHLVPRLLIDGTVSTLGELLLVTFTNDAARELAARVRRVLLRLSQPADEEERREPAGHLARLRERVGKTVGAARRLEAALRDLDQLAASTIHSFCQRTLQQEGALCGLPVMPELTTDDGDQLEELLREAWLGEQDARPMLAAVATGGDWKIRDAAAFLRVHRAAQCVGGATSMPQVAALDTVLDRIQAFAGRLRRDGSGWAELEPLLAAPGVTFSKQANYTLAGLLPQVELVLDGRVESPGFWRQLSAAAGLAGFINGTRSREAKRAVGASRWVADASRLESEVQLLEWSWHHYLAGQLLPALAARIQLRRLITQDGLIATLHRALTAGDDRARSLAARLAGRFKVGLIDEGQDVDPRQLAIFEAIFLRPQETGRLLLIGDPKQAIYRFRGADLAAYLEARDRARCRYSLTHTFRAPERLVRAQNALFTRRGAFHHPGMPFTPAQSGLTSEPALRVNGRQLAPVQVWIADEEREELKAGDRRVQTLAGVIADTIISLLGPGAELSLAGGSRPVTLSDCAVLTRTNQQAARMAEVLEERGLPVLLNSGASVFASEEAAEVRDLLHAVLQPTRTVRLRWALATRLLGLEAAELRAFDERPEEEERWRQLFSGWQGRWRREGLAALWSALDTPGDVLREGVSQRLARQVPGGERRATNYRQVTDLLLEASRDQFPRAGDLLRWLEQRIATAEERDVPEEHQIQLASEANAVRVLTMHKSKGLQYKLVFCPGLAEPLRNPDGIQEVKLAGDRTVANLGLLAQDHPARNEVAFADLEENLRLAYVAVTRAEVGLWIISYSAQAKGNLGAAPLDWLLRSSEECAAHTRFSQEWAALAKANRSARHRRVLEPLEPLGVETRPLPAVTNLRWQSQPVEAPAGAPAPVAALPTPPVPAAWTGTSFSRLTHSTDSPRVPDEKCDFGSGAEGTDDPVPPEETSAAAAATPGQLLFLRSPRGASVGTPVHEWLENWDFRPLPSLGGPSRTPLELHFSRAGLPRPTADQPAWEPCLQELFGVLREVRLPLAAGVSPPLHELTGDAGASEWNFDLPLRRETRFPASFAECFLASGPEGAAYAAVLAQLPPRAAASLLTGVIDRVVCLEGAWGLIDWKTNWLGDDSGAYGEAALRTCAHASHYWLQMHLYLVALRRWRRALGETNPRLAGAWLVFLRGIAPRSAQGVFAVCPSDSLLDALDALFVPIPAPVVTGRGATGPV